MQRPVLVDVIFHIQADVVEGIIHPPAGWLPDNAFTPHGVLADDPQEFDCAGRKDDQRRYPVFERGLAQGFIKQAHGFKSLAA